MTSEVLKNEFRNQIRHCSFLKLRPLFQSVKKTKDVLVHTHMLCVEEFRTMQRTFQYN